MIQRTGDRRRSLLYGVLLFIALLFAQVLVGCGSAAQTRASGAPPASTSQATPAHPALTTNTPTAAPTQQHGTQATPTQQPTDSSPALHGPTNFLFTTPFNFVSVSGTTTDDKGASTQLDAATIKTRVTQELKHLLFVVDTNDTLKVYSQGTKPVSAQMLFNPDGTTTINYTQTADSEAGSVSILFSGMLSTKQIEVSYEQRYTPSMFINAQASNIQVAFTAPIKWVAPREIPAAPSNGTAQLTSQGGATLVWSAGQNATAYDVYRLISDQSQQFQLLATIKETAYSDNSKETLKNIHENKSITYAIFSVGPTGVENPGGIIISI